MDSPDCREEETGNIRNIIVVQKHTDEQSCTIIYTAAISVYLLM